MSNILKAEYKPSFNRKRGATLHPYKKIFLHCSLIKFTGTPENIKEIKYFLPKGSFVKKEESGIFYLNTVKELFFLNHKEAKEAVLIKESIHINDWISVDSCNEAECIEEKDFDRKITLAD
jgi:hypothetical protein